MNRRQTPSSDMDRLQTNYSFLLEEIDAMVLVPKLFELRVITRHDKEAIQIQAQSQNTKAGNDKLLDILFRSGNNPYKGFMESLSINGYHHVVRRLELDVNNQSPETVDDSKRVDDLLSKYNTQQQTINSLIQSNTKQQQTINKQQQSNNKQQQTINKQQQDINALTQSNNQLKEEFQSLKEEVRCIKQQLGAQRTETPTNNEKDNRPIPCEKMLPKERKGSPLTFKNITNITEELFRLQAMQRRKLMLSPFSASFDSEAEFYKEAMKRQEILRKVGYNEK